MDELRKIYEAAGSDLEKSLERFGGNEEMLKRLLCLFVKDKSFEDLKKSLEEGKTEDAFRAAHTLKGICANLGFEVLYAKASEITEHLRHGGLCDAKTLFPELAEAYWNVTGKIKRLL